jgi:hypothetical protein
MEFDMSAVDNIDLDLNVLVKFNVDNIKKDLISRINELMSNPNKDESAWKFIKSDIKYKGYNRSKLEFKYDKAHTEDNFQEFFFKEDNEDIKKLIFNPYIKKLSLIQDTITSLNKYNERLRSALLIGNVKDNLISATMSSSNVGINEAFKSAEKTKPLGIDQNTIESYLEPIVKDANKFIKGFQDFTKEYITKDECINNIGLKEDISILCNCIKNLCEKDKLNDGEMAYTFKTAILSDQLKNSIQNINKIFNSVLQLDYRYLKNEVFNLAPGCKNIKSYLEKENFKFIGKKKLNQLKRANYFTDYRDYYVKKV